MHPIPCKPTKELSSHFESHEPVQVTHRPSLDFLPTKPDVMPLCHACRAGESVTFCMEKRKSEDSTAQPVNRPEKLCPSDRPVATSACPFPPRRDITRLKTQVWVVSLRHPIRGFLGPKCCARRPSRLCWLDVNMGCR